MKDSQFDHALQTLKTKPLPKAPRIEAEVLSAIRHSYGRNKPGIHLEWLEVLLRPRFATACLALVLMSSIAVSGLSSTARQTKNNYSQTAARALGFDTFQATDLLALSAPSTW